MQIMDNSPRLQETKQAKARFTNSLIASFFILIASYAICKSSLVYFSWIVLGLTVFSILSVTVYFKFEKKGKVPVVVKVLYVPTRFACKMAPTLLSIASWTCVFLIPLIFIIIALVPFSAYIYYLPAYRIFQWGCILTFALVSEYGERLYASFFAPCLNPEYAEFGKKLFNPTQSHVYIYLYAFVDIVLVQTDNQGTIAVLAAYLRFITNSKGFREAYQKISFDYDNLFRIQGKANL